MNLGCPGAREQPTLSITWNQRNDQEVERSVGRALATHERPRAKVVTSERPAQLQQASFSILSSSFWSRFKLKFLNGTCRTVEDAKEKLDELEKKLNSNDVGSDLRSCKQLLHAHQVRVQTHNVIYQRSRHPDGSITRHVTVIQAIFSNTFTAGSFNCFGFFPNFFSNWSVTDKSQAE